MRFKTGLNPSPKPPELEFRSYLRDGVLPPIPDVFGHYDLIPAHGWRMLGNDSVGDCTVAGAMHCSMLWNAIAKKAVRYTTLDALDDYSAITGYNRKDPESDTGADMVTVASYWRKTGFRDSLDRRHQIGAYMQVAPSRMDYIFAAAYLFGAVGLGVNLPSSAEDQFLHGQPWTIVSGDSIEGGHYIPLVGRLANGNAVIVTWGSIQEVTQDWLQQYLMAVVAMVSQEQMVSDKSPEGYDFAALQDDLNIIGT